MNALSLEFIHRCIHNACPEKEWLSMQYGMCACVCVCIYVCVRHPHMHVECVYDVLPCTVCLGDRKSADWWANVCFNEPLQPIHLERDLVSHITLLLLLAEGIWHIHHQSIVCMCGCVCVHMVFADVVLLHLFGQYLRLSWCFKCVCCKSLMVWAVICHLCHFRPSGLN